MNKIVTGPKEARRLAKSILSTREILRNVERLKSLGATVKYVSVDITDKNLLSLELEKVRQDWGPITGELFMGLVFWLTKKLLKNQ